MVLGPVVKEAFRIGVKALTRYYRIEGQAFNKLYRGFPQSKTIGRGVRHGLTAGSVAGSLISDSGDSPGNGVQTPFTRTKSPSRRQNQTRGRQATRTNVRCPGGRIPYTSKRRSRFSQYN